MEVDVPQLLEPPHDWVDTPEQAQMRACLIQALSGHSHVKTVRVASELIELIRDHLLSGAAIVRRDAASKARMEMSSRELAVASGQSRPTIARLLTEHKQYGSA